MNLQQHEKRDDMMVWLSQDEVTGLLEAVDGTQQRISLALSGRCGLRSHEVLDVASENVIDTNASTMLRMWHGKATSSEKPSPARSRDDYPHD